jgi:CheY-like chemotaxis protein
MDKFTYLVIENAPDVCEGIIRRMDGFEKWESLGYCTGVKEAIQKIYAIRPHLLYLDWSLNGGSAFEILQQVQNMPDYNPYIIFNTGFQKDNPEIPQEIINNYKVDKYLIKPLWETLRSNLPVYLKEAEEKVNFKKEKAPSIWVEDNTGVMVQITLIKLICICQHPNEPRCRIFYFEPPLKEITVPLQWQKCYDLLESNKIDYFITKSRSHLVVRSSVEKFDRPFVRLKNFPAKIEVVKESLKEFENWLIKS